MDARVRARRATGRVEAGVGGACAQSRPARGKARQMNEIAILLSICLVMVLFYVRPRRSWMPRRKEIVVPDWSSDEKVRQDVKESVLEALQVDGSAYEMIDAVEHVLEQAAYGLGAGDARFQEEIECPFEERKWSHGDAPTPLRDYWFAGAHDGALETVWEINEKNARALERGLERMWFGYLVGPDDYKRNGYIYAPGWVYIMECGPYYKIGMSKRPNKRCARLSTKPPFDIVLLHWFPADNARKAEQILHEDYAEYRKNGEWFELPRDGVKHLRQLGVYVCGQFYEWPKGSRR